MSITLAHPFRIDSNGRAVGVLQDLMLGDVLTVTWSSAFVLMVGGLALRAVFTALAELDAAIRDAEV